MPAPRSRRAVLRPRVPATALAAAALACLVGCGGERYAPVAGTVTLDGQPLADAKLVFEPVGGESGNAAGKPSYGRTDEAGRYTLTCPIAGTDGAAVGEHRVRVVTLSANEWTPKQMEDARARLQREEKAGGSTATVSDDRVRGYLSDRFPVTARESLPAKYNAETELTLTVPSEGTDKADFDLTTSQ